MTVVEREKAGGLKFEVTSEMPPDPFVLQLQPKRWQCADDGGIPGGSCRNLRRQLFHIKARW
jgi:hypothetical protein